MDNFKNNFLMERHCSLPIFGCKNILTLSTFTFNTKPSMVFFSVKI